MRYYDIAVLNATSGQPIAHWTSYPAGLQGPPDPNALLVEFDALTIDHSTTSSNAMIAVHGLGITALNEAQSYFGQTVELRGGMGPGLPLANPRQAGLLLRGTIFQAWGNWVGTEMALNFIVTPGPLVPDEHGIAGNFGINWTRGQTLQAALTQTFRVAYGAKVPQIVFTLGGAYVASTDTPGVYPTLASLGGAIEAATAFDPHGPVRIYLHAGKIIVTDQAPTSAATVHPVLFTDLIGQPTWIGTDQIQVTTVLRADLDVGDTIQITGAQGQALPGGPGFATIGGNNVFPNSFRYRAAFSQPLRIIQMRHIGNSRASDAAEWTTVVNCVPAGA